MRTVRSVIDPGIHKIFERTTHSRPVHTYTVTEPVPHRYIPGHENVNHCHQMPTRKYEEIRTNCPRETFRQNYCSHLPTIYEKDVCEKPPAGFFYHDTYKGCNNWRERADLAKMPSPYSHHFSNWKRAEENGIFLF